MTFSPLITKDKRCEKRRGYLYSSYYILVFTEGFGTRVVLLRVRIHISAQSLTGYQTKIFRIVKVENVCSRQIKIGTYDTICLRNG